MEDSCKSTYNSPETEAIEINQEGVICGSSDGVPGMAHGWDLDF